MRKLSITQERALGKLIDNGGWITSYRLSESLPTMRSLHNRGLATVRGYGKPGAFGSPQTTLEYKASSAQNKA